MPNLIDLKIHNITIYGYSYANKQLQQYFSFSLISSKQTELTFDEIMAIIANAGCVDERHLIPATGVVFDAGKLYTVTGVYQYSTTSLGWCFWKNEEVDIGALNFNIVGDFKDCIYSMQ